MGYEVLAGAEHSTYYEAGSCPGPQHGTRIGRKHKKKYRRSYRHQCVDIEVNMDGNIVRSDHVKTSSSVNHHPCKGLGKSTFLGVESNSHGHQPAYSGKSEHFDNKRFAFKCDVRDNKMNSTNLKRWSSSTHTNGGSSGAYVKDNSGAVRSIWDQLVMGIDVSGKASSEGFCKKVENLSTVVKSDGTTCYQKIDDTLKKTNRKLFCDKNETDELCACRNISTYGTKRCVEEKPWLPGCKEIKEQFDKFPAKANTDTPPINWTPTCFSSGICARPGQYLPENEPQACSQTITICSQDLEFGDVTGGAVTVNQDMDCDASTDRGGGGGGGGGDEGGSDGDEGAGGGGDGDTEEETGFKAYIPKSLDGLGTDGKQQFGAVGVVMMCCCCCLLVLLLLSPGGGGPVARRFSR